MPQAGAENTDVVSFNFEGIPKVYIPIPSPGAQEHYINPFTHAGDV